MPYNKVDRRQNRPIEMVYPSWRNGYKNPRYILSILLFTCIILVNVFWFLRVRQQEPTLTPEQTEILRSFLNKTELKIVWRDDWNAKSPRDRLKLINLPSNRVVIAQTQMDGCNTPDECVSVVRTLQTFNMEAKELGDIAFHFLIGGDGFVYEGRGWDFQGPVHRDFGEKTLCIAFIGTFRQEEPPQHQIVAVQKLIQLSVELGKISMGYDLVLAKESPSLVLKEIIKHWPHWAEQ